MRIHALNHVLERVGGVRVVAAGIDSDKPDILPDKYQYGLARHFVRPGVIKTMVPRGRGPQHSGVVEIGHPVSAADGRRQLEVGCAPLEQKSKRMSFVLYLVANVALSL